MTFTLTPRISQKTAMTMLHFNHWPGSPLPCTASKEYTSIPISIKKKTAAPFVFTSSVFCLRKSEAVRKTTTELLAAYWAIEELKWSCTGVNFKQVHTSHTGGSVQPRMEEVIGWSGKGGWIWLKRLTGCHGVHVSRVSFQGERYFTVYWPHQ